MMLTIVFIFSLSAPAFGFDWTGDRPRTLEGTGICSDNTLDAQQTLKYVSIFNIHRGSYTSALVLLNLLNELGKRDKRRGLHGSNLNANTN